MLCFDDILLLPQYSEVLSRHSVDLTIPGMPFNPLVASPMDTVVNSQVAITMAEQGGIAVLHRYNTVAEQVSSFQACAEKAPNTFCAIGVTGDYQERARALYEAGCYNFCIDVAHGHHILMKNALTWVRKHYGVTIMAGNVATLEGFNALADWGADMIRVGIGGGSVCTTRIQTGHGIPTLTSILECAKSDRKALLVADGGIRNSGDIVKALACGADMVMIGFLLAGHKESPGEIIYLDGRPYKEYRGMASSSAQKDWRGKVSVEEGVSTTVPYRGKLVTTLEVLKAGIRSGCSYSGVATIGELKSKAKWEQVTTNTAGENAPHARGK